MGNLFSSSTTKKAKKYQAPATAITDVDKAILSMKTQRRKLEDQGKLLEQRMDNQREAAKQLVVEGRKDRALLMLKKRKLTEQQLHQVQNLVLKVEEMLRNVEMSKQSTKIFDVLNEGNQALKQLQQQWSVEDVQKLMDDTAEAKQYQEELDVILSQSLNEQETGEAESELHELEQLVADAERLELPKVPQAKVQLPAIQSKEERTQKEQAAKEATMLAA